MNVEVILEHMSSGFLVINEDGLITRANARATSMLRKPLRDLVGQSIWVAFPGLSGSDAERELRQAVAGPVQRRFELFSPELYNWFAFTAAPAGDGNTYVFFTDVTDRERAIQSEAIKESLRRILMDAPVAITIMRGPEHRIELMNSSARALLGGRDLEGLTVRNALPEVDSALFDVLDTVYRNGEKVTLPDLAVTYDREGNGVLYDGTFDITYQPMRDTTGAVVGITSTSVETTGYAAGRKSFSTANST